MSRNEEELHKRIANLERELDQYLAGDVPLDWLDTVAEMTEAGESAAQIAHTLGVSKRSVHRYRRRLRRMSRGLRSGR